MVSKESEKVKCVCVSADCSSVKWRPLVLVNLGSQEPLKWAQQRVVAF